MATVGQSHCFETSMIELNLPTMTCGHCVRTVSETVQGVDAAARVNVDLATKTVRIESSHARQEFERALSEQGYAPAV
jgi:copper chaperone